MLKKLDNRSVCSEKKKKKKKEEEQDNADEDAAGTLSSWTRCQSLRVQDSREEAERKAVRRASLGNSTLWHRCSFD
jgi:hypothetical protein